mmetsp:Transcript_12136/g.48874  ORF Transcript_12136/g.48874 Transcript_12136/m.48874 type:complete len:272 (-) Transcript_12136:6-821(-)
MHVDGTTLDEISMLHDARGTKVHFVRRARGLERNRAREVRRGGVEVAPRVQRRPEVVVSDGARVVVADDVAIRLDRLGRVALLHVAVADVDRRVGVLGRGAQRGLEARDRRVEAALLFVDVAQVVQRRVVRRVEAEHAAVARGGVVEVAGVLQRRAQVQQHVGARAVELRGLGELRHRLLDVAARVRLDGFRPEPLRLVGVGARRPRRRGAAAAAEEVLHFPLGRLGRVAAPRRVEAAADARRDARGAPMERRRGVGHRALLRGPRSPNLG